MKDDFKSLSGKLLLAMPGMGDPRFYKSVILLCSHDANGAMGLVINNRVLDLKFGQLLQQLGIEPKTSAPIEMPILTGGPVETGRGFLIHTADFSLPDTITVDNHFGVSGTLDALKKIAHGQGPKDLLFVLGYAGWGAGQLEREIQDNAWMIADFDYDLLFNTSLEDKWDRAMNRIGVNPMLLSTTAGHA